MSSWDESWDDETRIMVSLRVNNMPRGIEILT